MTFKPEYIPRILLSLILFSLGSSLLLFAPSGCLCPLVTVGQPLPASLVYPVWELLLVVLLIGAGVLVLVLPRDKPIRRTESPSPTDSSSNSGPPIPAMEKDLTE